jgi:hypothetical protein
MNVHIEIAKLRREIAGLKVRIVDLNKALNRQEDDIDWLIEKHAEELSELYTVLWPVVHHVFPNYGKTRAQLDSILKKHKSPKSCKEDPSS